MHNGNFGGVSLGLFIFVNNSKSEDWKSDAIIHEYGHTFQSLFLGPLYLLVVGIPSSIWCNCKKYIELRKNNDISYYSFIVEKHANILGEKFAKQKIKGTD